MSTISPFLWFNDNAEEATKLYTSVFDDASVGRTARYDEAGAKASGRKAGSVMTVEFRIEGQTFTALNGGPVFSFTPAISFFVHCATREKMDKVWSSLSQGGKIMMPLQEYPWSPCYGWCSDRFGVSWQLFLGERAQKIAPCLMFTGKVDGKAEEAMRFYMSIFPDSKEEMLARYEKGEGNTEGKVKHARFTLAEQEFVAMDGGKAHAFGFTPATSFIVNCDTQKEVDTYWEALTKGGEEVQCGWLTDKYGVSWQIVPRILGTLMADKDPAKSKCVMEAMLTMKKLDIAELEKAAGKS